MTLESYSYELSNPELLKDLGLIGRYHSINIAATKEGKPKGDVILTEPNKALGESTYNYYIQLGGYQLDIAIDPAVYLDYEAELTDLSYAIRRDTEAALNSVHDKIDAFFNTVTTTLSNKPISPSLQVLQGQFSESPSMTEQPLSAPIENKILHHNALLNADLNDNPVELGNAELLYQPVHATGSGSNPYYLIATSLDGIKIAARYDGKTLDFRLLCTWYNADSRDILEVLVSDFAFVKRGGGHYSLSVEVPNTRGANRFIYAILSEFSPIRLNLGLPDVHDFKG
ncbi:hypothetical protein VPEG_00061 [Vibrio phage SIO-2]|uniref:hypothetical protein n=1 Tax=Vibrio phage SIO-2 TaxID=700512 RepID=UPI0002357C63|nr:hypothetical protein VPEG_00061 [Vibrio phage SIO-2]AET42212.1 hypothetical protein VPEG_00061 [Vibrio phage SIO-2]